jgi:tetratricopeptide (TPR) repeat protein
LELCEREAGLLGENDPERRQAIWLRAGELARDHTAEPARALRAYVNAAAAAALPLERRAERAELHGACDEPEAFAEVFADWCDDPTEPASCADHVRLAAALEDLGRIDDAISRVERALAIDAAFGPAWEVAARLHETRGDTSRAAEAWTRAGELIEDGKAAERMLRAAGLVAADDPEQAWIVLRRASACDPAAADVQAAMAELAANRNAPEETESAAASALELWSADAPPDNEKRLRVALIGAHAARERGRPEAAARFYAAILELEPQHPEALAGAGEALAEAGDYTAARAALEARLADGDTYPERAQHHTLLGRCLEAAGEPEAALEHCEAALRDDPGQDEAHERCVGLHRTAGRVDAGIAALERWAEQARNPSERAARLLRAGEWERNETGLEVAAERHLRDALRADPGCARAAESLATLLWEAERPDEALAVASQGLDAATDADTRRDLSLIRARVLEKAGDRPEAAEAFARAAEADPRCLEGAMAGARLLRSMGSWPEAATALQAFADAHPGDDPLGLAQVFHQLGRLRAGPLEDVDGAIDAYRRSVVLDPDHGDARDALAQLLSHRPDGWQEAIEHHRAALELDPTRSAALRTVLRIARERNRPGLVVNGLAIVRALGVASTEEIEHAPTTLTIPIAGDASLSDPLWEKLRQVAQASAREIGRALEVGDDSGVVSSEAPAAAFHAAALAAEANLAAPALLPLPTPELGETLILVATIALESEALHASGRTLNALSSALGRRTRRRLRRILDDVSVEAIEAIDFAAWRDELRAVAAAQALDTTGGDLRAALVALLSDGEEPADDDFREDADLTTLVRGCPEARALLGRAVRAWMADF